MFYVPCWFKPVSFFHLKTDHGSELSTNGGYSCCIRHSPPGCGKLVLSVWFGNNLVPQRLQLKVCSSSLSLKSAAHGKWEAGRSGWRWAETREGSRHAIMLVPGVPSWSPDSQPCKPWGLPVGKRRAYLGLSFWGPFLAGLLLHFSRGRFPPSFTSAEGFPSPEEAVVVSQLSWARHCKCISTSNTHL